MTMSSSPQYGPDVSKPNAARMYDYYLGGAHNFEIDRGLADQILAISPRVAEGARANRAFLRRAVRYCMDQGIRQFLDLGSGVPTVGHVHQVAHRIDPETRIVYVDNEPVAVHATRQLLTDIPNTEIVDADLRDPEAVLSSPGVRAMIDFSQPVAVLAVAVLHFVSDEDDPAGILAGYRRVLLPGSHLVLSHITPGYDDPDAIAAVVRLYKTSSNPAYLRNREQVAEIMAGLDIVPPGVVYTPEWHPEEVVEHPERSGFLAAVGRVTENAR